MPRLLGSVLPATVLLLGCQGTGLGWQGGPGPSLAQYRAAFAREVGEDFTGAMRMPELKAQLRACRVLWLGDHHRDRQLHDLQRDLLRDLRASGFALAIGLEAIGTEDLGPVRDYLDGRIGMTVLRTGLQARWPGCWLDSDDVDAEHYRQLLAFAKATSTPVFALEPVPRLPLGRRDAAIADSVVHAAAEHADRLLVVVIGQAHLLGHGDLPARAGLPAIALGGAPTPDLEYAARGRSAGAELLQSRGGLWYFAALLTR